MNRFALPLLTMFLAANVMAQEPEPPVPPGGGDDCETHTTGLLVVGRGATATEALFNAIALVAQGYNEAVANFDKGEICSSRLVVKSSRGGRLGDEFIHTIRADVIIKYKPKKQDPGPEPEPEPMPQPVGGN